MPHSLQAGKCFTRCKYPFKIRITVCMTPATTVQLRCDTRGLACLVQLFGKGTLHAVASLGRSTFKTRPVVSKPAVSWDQSSYLFLRYISGPLAMPFTWRASMPAARSSIPHLQRCWNSACSHGGTCGCLAGLGVRVERGVKVVKRTRNLVRRP